MKARGRPKDYPWTVQPGARKSDSGPHIEEVVEHNTHKPDSRSGKKVYEGDMVGIRVTAHYDSMEEQPHSPDTPSVLSVKQTRKQKKLIKKLEQHKSKKKKQPKQKKPKQHRKKKLIKNQKKREKQKDRYRRYNQKHRSHKKYGSTNNNDSNSNSTTVYVSVTTSLLGDTMPVSNYVFRAVLLAAICCSTSFLMVLTHCCKMTTDNDRISREKDDLVSE